MKLISNAAAGLLCAIALSASAADQPQKGSARAAQSNAAPIDLPLTLTNVDVTQNIKRRFGAPHVAVNPRNPNNVVVVASSNMGYTRAW